MLPQNTNEESPEGLIEALQFVDWNDDEISSSTSSLISLSSSASSSSYSCEFCTKDIQNYCECYRDVCEEKYPKTFQEAQEIEDLLEREMQSLSIADREKILFDLHGFSEPQHEEEFEKDETNINQLLQQIEDELNKAVNNDDHDHDSGKETEAYIQARKINESFVASRPFRLMFLRGERYNPKSAAKKLLKHFTMKRWLFGSGEVLGRHVRLSDLSDDDMTTLSSGGYQVLPTRDAAGRTIIFFSSLDKFKYAHVDNVFRTVWYVCNVVLLDEETQKRGVIFVGFTNISDLDENEIKVMKHVHVLRQGIPQKVVGGHYCYTNASLRPFVAGVTFLLEKDLRVRFRHHYGTRDDVIFKLQTFGIDMRYHPITEDGNMALSWHHQWLKIRQAQEEEEKESNNGNASQHNDDTVIIIPRRFDVLFGRGNGLRTHTGNMRANHLVLMHEEDYERANKYEKTEITERIVNIIHESNGRFLKWETNKWVEVEYDVAREKISHFFRHNRSKKKTVDQKSLSNTEKQKDVVSRKRCNKNPTEDSK